MTGTRRRILTAQTWEELQKYSSVSVCCTDGACVAAKAIAGERLLLEQAPQLPLAGCDSANCQCTLVSHRDRRSFLGNRRSAGRLVVDTVPDPASGNRRSGTDRRSIRVDFKPAPC